MGKIVLAACFLCAVEQVKEQWVTLRSVLVTTVAVSPSPVCPRADVKGCKERH